MTRRDLTHIADEALFAVVQAERRTVVTENVGDFVPIAQAYAASGRSHLGLVLVSAKAFPRDRVNRDATLGRMVVALDAVLRAHPHERDDSMSVFLQAP